MLLAFLCTVEQTLMHGAHVAGRLAGRVTTPESKTSSEVQNKNKRLYPNALQCTEVLVASTAQIASRASTSFSSFFFLVSHSAPRHHHHIHLMRLPIAQFLIEKFLKSFCLALPCLALPCGRAAKHYNNKILFLAHH